MNHYVTYWDLLIYTAVWVVSGLVWHIAGDLRQLRKDRLAALKKFAPPERTLEDTEP